MTRTGRTVRVVQNTVSTALYQLTAMLMGFVTPRLMMVCYGSEVNGLIVSITEFLTYFKLVEAGLASAAVVGLYKPLAEGDDARVSAIVSAARSFYNIAGFIFCGITVVFAAIYPIFVPVHSITGGEMSYLSVMLLICAMGVSGALEFFTLSRYRVLLTADQKTSVVSLASMASLLLSTGLIVILSLLRVDIAIVRLAASLTLVLRSVLLHIYVKKRYPNIDVMAKPDKGPLAKRWDAMYQQLTVAFHQGAGVMLTTVITRDATLISVYGTYHMVTVGLWGVLKMTTTGIYSSFGNLLVSGQKTQFQKAYKDFEFLYLSLVTILFSAAAVLIVPFVMIYTNGVLDANYYAPMIGMLIIVEALTDHGKMPMDLMIIASGTFRETRRHCTIQVLSAAALGLGLGFLWGIPGMLLGIILSNLIRTGLQLSFVPRHVTGLDWRISFKRILRMLVEAALIAAPFLMFGPSINSFFMWMVYAVGLVVYATAVTVGCAWLFEKDSLMSVVDRVRVLIQKH